MPDHAEPSNWGAMPMYVFGAFVALAACVSAI